MKYDCVVYSLTFAAYSGLLTDDSDFLVAAEFAVLAVDGCAVFGFSVFCACTYRETCESARPAVRAKAMNRILCRKTFDFMMDSKEESSTRAKHTATRGNLPERSVARIVREGLEMELVS